MKITLNFDDHLSPDDELSSKYKADLMNTLWVVAKTAAKDHFKGAEVDDKTLMQLANNEWGRVEQDRLEVMEYQRSCPPSLAGRTSLSLRRELAYRSP